MIIHTNKYQTPIDDVLLDSLNDEVKEQLLDFINNVEFIKNLISPNRLYAKDLPRDEDNKIIIDLVNPHIIEDMDYFRPSAIHFENHGCFTFLKPNGNPHSEYGKWINEEKRRCWEGYIRPTDGEWVTGYLYYFLNYSPIMLTKIIENKKGKKYAHRTEAFPECWEGIYWRFHYMQQAREGGLYDNEGGKNCAELASRGKGKAHPYSQDVFTPKGWCKWGDLQIGDYVYGDDGKPTKIIDIPYNEESDIYEITLIDGRKIRCTSGHLFKVKDHNKKRIIIKSLEDIKCDYITKRTVTKKNTTGREFNYRLPASNAVEFSNIDSELDAYTLGVILGDGCLRTVKYSNSVYFTSQDVDVDTYKKNIPYNIDKLNGKYLYAIRVNTNCISDIWNLKSEDKYIPHRFLHSSTNYRLNLLRGLMDTDGTVTFGTPIFSTSSEKLKNDVVFLVRSLGYNCSVSSKIPKINGKEYLRNWSIRIYTNDRIFNLKRKYDLVSHNIRTDWTSIVDIKYVGKEFAKCITVDNKSHCYTVGDFVVTHNSYSLGSILAHNFILGENAETKHKVNSIVTAYKKEYLTKDGVLNKFVSMIDFNAEYTQFPRKRLKNSIQEMTWKMGYKDVDLEIDKGTLNTVMGVSSKDDESKLRGKRAAKILIEEFGSFARLLDLYNVLLPSVREGEYSFGQIYLLGTAGDDDSDFSGAQELIYNPKGYGIYALPNVYDKSNTGKPEFTYFFPGYINRKGCYNKDGVSDVVKALIEILNNRHHVKYNSTDPNTIIKTIAEIPITPAEAIIKYGVNMFPVTMLTERLMQLDSNPREFDDVFIGDIIVEGREAKYKPSSGVPIRQFPMKDNANTKGSIEIFKLPERDEHGKVFNNRYILGADPVDDDAANGDKINKLSLASVFVLDTWTDRLVAEYTGRDIMVDDYYEKCRSLCIFYNGQLCYENNKKGLFAYFSRYNAIHLLADNLEFLKDKDMAKGYTIGNKSKGINATQKINNYARERIRNWLLTPTIVVNSEGEEVETFNLFTIRNRALLQELINYNSEGNFDRISALGMVMLYRQEKLIMCNGDIKKSINSTKGSSLTKDPFFDKNYRRRR